MGKGKNKARERDRERERLYWAKQHQGAGNGFAHDDTDTDGESDRGDWVEVGAHGKTVPSTRPPAPPPPSRRSHGHEEKVGAPARLVQEVKAARMVAPPPPLSDPAVVSASVATTSHHQGNSMGQDQAGELKSLMKQLMGQVGEVKNEIAQVQRNLDTATAETKSTVAKIEREVKEIRDVNRQGQQQQQAATVARPLAPPPPFLNPRMAAALNPGAAAAGAEGGEDSGRAQGQEQHPLLQMPPLEIPATPAVGGVGGLYGIQSYPFGGGVPWSQQGSFESLPPDLYTGACDVEEEPQDEHMFSKEEEEQHRLVDEVLDKARSLEKEVDEHRYLIADESQTVTFAKAMEQKINEIYDKDRDDGEGVLDAFRRLLSQIDNMRDSLREKVAFFEPYLDKGAVFVGGHDNIKTKLRDHPSQDIFVFNFNYSERKEEAETWQAFDRLMQFKQQQNKDSRAQCQCFMVDQELREPGKKLKESIEKYHNGDAVCTDLLTTLKQLNQASLGFCSSFELGRKKPVKKTHFEAPCPNHFDPDRNVGCTDKKVAWQCVSCFDQLEYGFDNYFYCSCGAGEVANFKFVCENPRHKDLVYYTKEVIQALVNNLKTFNGLTILILGETGVGKSTFINGFANYLSFQTLDDAKGQFQSPVKATFVLTKDNDDFEQVTITTGQEDNESQVVGQSATQDAKAHVFSYKGSQNVRLIDTPGIGDTRGIEQDRENFQRILSYISYYEDIHGICVLLKPNESRLTVMFEFCLKELLTHLHKSAANNIVFCFTNSRTTSYIPGETLQLLRKMLNENKNIPIQLKKQNVYCLDNESFRYLAALHHGIEFGEDKDTMYQASWEISKRETDRLMEHVCTLEPHKVQETVTINNVRRQILDLTKPLAAIAKHIGTTVSNFEDQKKEIEDSEESAEDILSKITIQVPTLERRSLPYPRTVCTGINCSQTHKIDGQDVKHFVVHCHEHCYLAGVQADVINNPDLKRCAAMSPSGGASCHVCKCEWNVHMHVTYEMEPVTKDGEDEAAKQRYTGITSQIELKRRVAEDLEVLTEELTYEKETIIRSCAQFGIFLKNNTVMTYNDAMIGYLNLMIKQAREKADQSQDYSQVDSLMNLKLRYEEEIQMIRDATEGTEDDEDVDEEAIKIAAAQVQHKILKGLFDLKHYGGNIERLLREIEEEKSAKVTFTESHYEERSGSRPGFLKSLATKVGGAVYTFLAMSTTVVTKRIFGSYVRKMAVEGPVTATAGEKSETGTVVRRSTRLASAKMIETRTNGAVTVSASGGGEGDGVADSSFQRRKEYDIDLKKRREEMAAARARQEQMQRQAQRPRQQPAQWAQWGYPVQTPWGYPVQMQVAGAGGFPTGPHQGLNNANWQWQQQPPPQILPRRQYDHQHYQHQ